jgi:hypothetical protein
MAGNRNIIGDNVTIKSEVYQGKIYAGATQLSCTIVVEQTAPMQLTVRSGVFTHTNGTTWTLESDAVFNLVSSPSYPTEVKIEIGDIQPDGIMDVWYGTCVRNGIDDFDVPAGWHTGHPLVFNFSIPAGCTDLTPLDIFVLTVLPGFPDGTTVADWQIQLGGAA